MPPISKLSASPLEKPTRPKARSAKTSVIGRSRQLGGPSRIKLALAA